MNTILKVILILVLFVALVGGTVYLLSKGYIKSEFSKRLSYRKESELVQDALYSLVKVDCEGVKSEPWYCNETTFTVDSVEPYHEVLYAQGTGKTQDNKEFYWLAAKIKGFWGTIYFEDSDKSLPECDHIKDFPADIFDQKLRYCLYNGQKIDRTEDTTPPETNILYPSEGGLILFRTEDKICLNLVPVDNVSSYNNILTSFAFDDQPMSEFTVVGTRICGDLDNGEHITKYQSKDEAGNLESLQTRSFIVDIRTEAP